MKSKKTEIIQNKNTLLFNVKYDNQKCNVKLSYIRIKSDGSSVPGFESQPVLMCFFLIFDFYIMYLRTTFLQ